MDDSDTWNIFAPIAKLESLDEIDQVWLVNIFFKFIYSIVYNELQDNSKHSNTEDKSQ